MKAFKFIGGIVIFNLSILVTGVVLNLHGPLPGGIPSMIKFTLSDPTTWFSWGAIVAAMAAISRLGNISVNLGSIVYAAAFAFVSGSYNSILTGLTNAGFLTPVIKQFFYWPIFLILIYGLIQTASGRLS